MYDFDEIVVGDTFVALLDFPQAAALEKGETLTIVEKDSERVYCYINDDPLTDLTYQFDAHCLGVVWGYITRWWA